MDTFHSWSLTNTVGLLNVRSVNTATSPLPPPPMKYLKCNKYARSFLPVQWPIVPFCYDVRLYVATLHQYFILATKKKKKKKSTKERKETNKKIETVSNEILRERISRLDPVWGSESFDFAIDFDIRFHEFFLKVDPLEMEIPRDGG